MSNSDFEQGIRAIVRDEIDRQAGRPHLQSVEDFCKSVGLSRVTLWRQEKQGQIKIHRIGKRCFVDPASIAK